MKPGSKQTKGKSKAKTTKTITKAGPSRSLRLPKVIPVAVDERESDLESSNDRENVVEVRNGNAKKGKNTQPLASSSRKENTRPGPTSPGSGSQPTKPKGRKYKKDSGEIYKKALRYHILKRAVLAPFLTRLLMRSQTDVFMNEIRFDNIENETINMDIFSSGTESRHTLPGLGLTTTTNSNSDDNESNASYQDDWRNGRGQESDSDSN